MKRKEEPHGCWSWNSNPASADSDTHLLFMPPPTLVQFGPRLAGDWCYSLATLTAKANTELVRPSDTKGSSWEEGVTDGFSHTLGDPANASKMLWWFDNKAMNSFFFFFFFLITPNRRNCKIIGSIRNIYWVPIICWFLSWHLRNSVNTYIELQCTGSGNKGRRRQGFCFRWTQSNRAIYRQTLYGSWG